MSDHISSGAYRGWIAGTRGEMSRQTIHRSGARPLVGMVALLGVGDVAGTGTTLYVLIARRQAGGYVVVRHHVTIWEGSEDSYEATLCPTPADVLAEMGGDEMRSAEQEAWEEAVAHDAGLAAISAVEI